LADETATVEMNSALLRLSRSAPLRWAWYAAALAFFALVVLLPPTYVFGYVVSGWSAIGDIMSRPEIASQVRYAVALSYKVSTLTTLVDLAFGLPLAWALVKRPFPGKRVVNTLLDIPMSVPTSARGLSVALYWMTLAHLADPLLGLTALQVAITFPYMVRSISSALEEVDYTYEVAARTLGAVPLTATRTVTIPLARAGIVAGSVLSFAQALSETGGATVLLLTLGLEQKNASVLIGYWKSLMKQEPSLAPTLLPAAAFLSFLMMASSLLILYAFKEVGMRLNLPEGRVMRSLEARLSCPPFPDLRDLVSGSFALAAFIFPSFFVAASATLVGVPLDFWLSVARSFLVAAGVTALDLAFAFPLAILVTRKLPRSASRLLDSLVDVPLLVPTAALGFSLGLFWTALMPGAPGLLLVGLAHVSFTFSLVARNLIAALHSMDPGLEAAARTLGADGAVIFRRVVLPVIKPSVAAGAVLAFARSLNETGATLAVYPEAITAPVYIVGLVKAGRMDLAGLATLLLGGVSFGVIYALRKAARVR